MKALASIGDLRDTVLFLGTATYVLGYLTWAIYSNDVGLGVMPPLEGQYFLAGVVPLLLLVASVLAFQGISPLADEARRARARKTSEVIVAASIFLILGPALIAQVKPLPSAWNAGLLLAGVAAMFVGLALSVRSAETGAGFVHWLLRLSVPLLFLAGLALCATRLFPRLPAELGGPRPRCIVLDVATASLAPETLAAMAVDASTAAARSGPLWLHFDGGGALVLSTRRGRPVPNAFRIREASVLAVLPDSRCGA